MNIPSFFASLFLTAVVMAAALAHLFEMPAKMALSRDEYLTVQQIYRGWALLGIAIIGAVLTTASLAVSARRDRAIFALALTALACLVAAQGVFWVATYPRRPTGR